MTCLSMPHSRMQLIRVAGHLGVRLPATPPLLLRQWRAGVPSTLHTEGQPRLSHVNVQNDHDVKDQQPADNECTQREMQTQREVHRTTQNQPNHRCKRRARPLPIGKGRNERAERPTPGMSTHLSKKDATQFALCVPEYTFT